MQVLVIVRFECLRVIPMCIYGFRAQNGLWVAQQSRGGKAGGESKVGLFVRENLIQ